MSRTLRSLKVLCGSDSRWPLSLLMSSPTTHKLTSMILSWPCAENDVQCKCHSLQVPRPLPPCWDALKTTSPSSTFSCSPAPCCTMCKSARNSCTVKCRKLCNADPIPLWINWGIEPSGAYLISQSWQEGRRSAAGCYKDFGKLTCWECTTAGIDIRWKIVEEIYPIPTKQTRQTISKIQGRTLEMAIHIAL